MRLRVLGAISTVVCVASCSLITSMEGFSPSAWCDEPGLVARWTFGEGAGSVAHDCTSFKHDGQLSNVSWGPGLNDGGGASFAGGWVSVEDTPTLRATGELTVSAWVDVRAFPTTSSTTTQPTAYIISKLTDRNSNGWRLALGKQPNIMFVVPPSSDVTATVPSTGWTHVAAVYRPNVSIALYVNGRSVATSTTNVPAAITAAEGELRIGSRIDGTYPFFGELDDVRVYERALSEVEISSLANNN